MRHSTGITTQEICTHILATFNSTHGKPVRLENERPPHDTAVLKLGLVQILQGMMIGFQEEVYPHQIILKLLYSHTIARASRSIVE